MAKENLDIRFQAQPDSENHVETANIDQVARSSAGAVIIKASDAVAFVRSCQQYAAYNPARMPFSASAGNIVMNWMLARAQAFERSVGVIPTKATGV